MKKRFFFALSLLLTFVVVQITKAAVPTLIERAYILPDNRECMSLNGIWQFQYPVGEKWNTIEVPGEVSMQGYAIEHDKPFIYKKTVVVPENYAGKRIILRFDGVYSQANLCINGKSVRKHQGGFTRWETDITSFVEPGKKNEIVVEVIDSKNDISYGSGYAHHPIGGILRDVTLFALPLSHLYDVNIETKFDASLTDATLLLSCFSEIEEPAEAIVTLLSPNGKDVTLLRNRFPLQTGSGEQKWELNVKKPLKWDAEHPHLYTLNVAIRNKNKQIYNFSRKIGFRQIEIKEKQMFVNGYPVKLRGACRHDIHPTLGRTTTAELDSLDAILFKESNMNFVRTSHYPPSERFLEYCDRYGIYVECETAVCFVATYRHANYKHNSQDDTEYTTHYLSQLREMVKSVRTHPSIIIWSIGNESKYGENFQLSWDWLKATDRTRPVIFSWPGLQKNDKPKIYDITSIHYPGTSGNLNQKGVPIKNFESEDKPALFDEWAHPACYTYETLQNDPNIREFWGQSIDMMWGRLFEVSGALGGAIWSYIDDTFMLPTPHTGNAYWKEFARTSKPENYLGKCVGYGEWGIVDVWRRKKPEFWATKKAYSPVRLLIGKNILDFTPKQALSLQIHNRFDHTNLNKIQSFYIYKGRKKEITLPSILPHQKGILTLPADDWSDGEKIRIEFYAQDGTLIDIYEPVLGTEKIQFPSPVAHKGISVDDTHTSLTIRGKNFEIPFDKETGLISNAKIDNNIIIEKGPFMNLYINLNHLSGAEVRKKAEPFNLNSNDWKKTALKYSQNKENILVYLSGTYQNIKVDFTINIDAKGYMSIAYKTDGIPHGMVRESGISFYMPEKIENVNWKRNGYWDYYPEGSFAGNEGCTPLYNEYNATYGEQPKQPWQSDTHNYFYWADAGTNCKKPLTQIAKGQKENIYYYTLSTKDKNGNSISVLSPEASVACRINKESNEQLILFINNKWDYPEIAWGNYCKRVKSLPCNGTINLLLK